MRHLLDINVLIALMDSNHAFHSRAHAWWAAQVRPWASCPLTENGLLRIMASPHYSKNTRLTLTELAARFDLFVRSTDHAFWPDSLSLRDGNHFRHAFILSSKHLTDIYLLALAAANKACLVTFDQHIPTPAVATAKSKHLMVI